MILIIVKTMSDKVVFSYYYCLQNFGELFWPGNEWYSAKLGQRLMMMCEMYKIITFLVKMP